MEKWLVALFVTGVVAIAMIGQGWVSWLEHKRRSKAMDVIQAALEAGREVPPQLYDQLSGGADSGMGATSGLGFSGKSPWSEVAVFAALSVAFWIAFAFSEGQQRVAFLVVAATMSVTGLGYLAYALFARRVSRNARGADDAA